MDSENNELIQRAAWLSTACVTAITYAVTRYIDGAESVVVDMPSCNEETEASIEAIAEYIQLCKPHLMGLTMKNPCDESRTDFMMCVGRCAGCGQLFLTVCKEGMPAHEIQQITLSYHNKSSAIALAHNSMIRTDLETLLNRIDSSEAGTPHPEMPDSDQS